MNSKYLAIGAIVIGSVAIIALINSMNNQNSTQRQLAELRQKLDQQAAAPAAKPSEAPSSRAADPATAQPIVTLESKASYVTDYVKKRQDIEKVMEAGWKLINLRSPEHAARAAELFEQALAQIDDKSPDLLNGLGRAYLVAGKPEKAIEAWKKGIEIEPRLVDMQSGLGWAYWSLKDYPNAREAWRTAVAKDPENIDAWSALAWIELALGNKAYAKEGFRILVNKNTQSKPWVLGLSMAQGGNTNPDHIKKFFPIPDDLSVFKKPGE